MYLGAARRRLSFEELRAAQGLVGDMHLASAMGVARLDIEGVPRSIVASCVGNAMHAPLARPPHWIHRRSYVAQH